MDRVTVEVLANDRPSDVADALRKTVRNGVVAEPPPVREPVLVTAIIVTAAVMEIVTGLLELRKAVKGLKVRGLLGTEVALDGAKQDALEAIAREGLTGDQEHH